MQQGFGFRTKLSRELDKARTSAADSPSFTFWTLLGQSPPKLPLSHQPGQKKTWLQRYSTMIIMEILRLNCWIVCRLLRNKPSTQPTVCLANLDVRQSPKSLTKQAPCARQGVQGHWPYRLIKKLLQDPKNPKSDEHIRVGRNPTGVENKLIFQIHLVVHQIIVAPSMTCSLACEPSVHPFLSHVLSLSSSGFLGLLHMVDTILPQKLLGSI